MRGLGWAALALAAAALSCGGAIEAERAPAQAKVAARPEALAEKLHTLEGFAYQSVSGAGDGFVATSIDLGARGLLVEKYDARLALTWNRRFPQASGAFLVVATPSGEVYLHGGTDCTRREFDEPTIIDGAQHSCAVLVKLDRFGRVAWQMDSGDVAVGLAVAPDGRVLVLRRTVSAFWPPDLAEYDGRGRLIHAWAAFGVEAIASDSDGGWVIAGRALQKIDPTGAILFTHLLPGRTRSVAVAGDGTIAVASEGRVSVFDREGARLWSAELSGAARVSAFGDFIAAVGVTAQQTVLDVFALDGERVWTRELPTQSGLSGVVASGAAASNAGIVFAGASTGLPDFGDGTRAFLLGVQPRG